MPDIKYNRILLIFVFLIFVNRYLLGQNYNKVYDFNTSQSWGATIVETDSFYIGFSLGGPNFGIPKVFVCEYDKNTGDLIRQNSFLDSTVSYYFYYHQETWVEKNVVKYITYAYELESLIVLEYDVGLKRITQKKISLKSIPGRVGFLNDIKKIGNKYYIYFSSRFGNPDDFNALPGILILNDDFSFVYRFYGDNVSNEYVLGSKAAITSDEMIIVGFSEYELRRKYNLPSSVYFVKINKKGDVIWKGKNLFDSEKLVLNNGNICTLNDSILFISGLKYNMNANEYPYIFFTKVMLIYDIKNDKILKRVLFPKAYENENPFPHSMLKKTHDNFILFGGGQSLIKGNTEEEDYLAGSLGKMDGNGNLLFYNSYLHFTVDSIGEYNDTWISDIEETVDGDILCYGEAYYKRRYSWLLKTDKNGNVKKTDLNLVFDQMDPKKNLLLLFPNPADNFVTIKYADFSIVSSILILDASGKIYTTFSLPDISHKSVQLDISSLPSGIYFVELRDQNNGFLEAKKFIKQ